MSYVLEPMAFRAEASERAAFIRRTYAHLAGAVLAFVAIEFALFRFLDAEELMRTMFRTPITALVMLAAFIGVGFLARMWAYSDTSPGMQYLGLTLYVVFEAVFFMPILWVANNYFAGQHLIETAGILTLCVFGGLTASVFITRKDYSWMGPALMMASFIMFGVIVVSIFFPIFSSGVMGLVVSLAMVAILSGYILYDTSNVIHHFRTTQHVAAALELFAHVALMFWYILRILMILASNRE